MSAQQNPSVDAQVARVSVWMKVTVGDRNFVASGTGKDAESAVHEAFQHARELMNAEKR